MRTHFPVRPSYCAVLALNIMTCDDADCDAERTVDELLSSIDDNNGWVPKAVLESALFCCNINSEDNKFAHPFNWDFVRFVTKVLGDEYFFDRYYNRIRSNEKN